MSKIESDALLTLPIFILEEKIVLPHNVLKLSIKITNNETSTEMVAPGKMIVIGMGTSRDIPETIFQGGKRIINVGCISKVLKHELLEDNLLITTQTLKRCDIRELFFNENGSCRVYFAKITSKVFKSNESQNLENLSKKMLILSKTLWSQRLMSRNIEMYREINSTKDVDPISLSYSLINTLDNYQYFQEKLKVLLMDNKEDILLFTLRVMNNLLDPFLLKDMYMEEENPQINPNMKLKEISDIIDDESDLADLKEKINGKDIPSDVLSVFEKEIKRLSKLPASSSEFSVCRSYLETLADFPWNIVNETSIDLNNAIDILNNEHFGLEDIKKRILQFVAVNILLNTASTTPSTAIQHSFVSQSTDNENKKKSPILCFVGPPGVGKTSLGRSMAKALGRKFEKISLGGVSDEAEIRGHRKTYVGAFPGSIVQALRRSNCTNPMILLDEIDKIGSKTNKSGDPFSALLEVLDPDQNECFTDNYLGIPINLSNIIFLATANRLDAIPLPLLDRMEIINLTGYAPEEKKKIALHFLIPKEIEAHGLNHFTNVIFTNGAIDDLINKYTREVGVRQLRREIASICRHIAMDIVLNEEHLSKKIVEERELSVDSNYILEVLGSPKYTTETILRQSIPGVTTGLAWTSLGGDLLFIEVKLIFKVNNQGYGEIIVSGNMGKVMEESCSLALTWIRSQLQRSQAKPNFVVDECWTQLIEAAFHRDIHIHVPAGSVPKDGPSAGSAITLALISAMSGIVVDTSIATTGEITLRGSVLPVGGIQEKLIAALRGGIKKVILPKDNRKDLERLKFSNKLSIIFVENIEELIVEVFPPNIQTYFISNSSNNKCPLSKVPVALTQGNLNEDEPKSLSSSSNEPGEILCCSSKPPHWISSL